jgi:hypothetical protein
LPDDSEDVLNVAVPELRATVPRVVVPSLKVTVPVAAGGATVAVKTTGWPLTAGFAEKLREVLLEAWLTVSVMAGEVLLA